jgi:micrococcal nuclease
MYTNNNSRSNNMGCCLFGLFIGLFTGIGLLIYRTILLLLPLIPWVIKGLYYFIAWPFLAFEYGWNRGGVWRIIALVGGVLFGVVMLVSILTAPPPAPKSTPTRTVIVVTATPSPSPTTVPATNTVPMPTSTPIASTATELPTAVGATSVPATLVPTVAQADVATATVAPQPDAGAPQPDAVAPNAAIPANAIAVTVKRVVDGDTIHVLLDNNDVTIRMIGIDTPETVDPRKPVQCFGKEASNHARQLLNGATVYLEIDDSQGDYDKYNRLLSYIWMSDGRMFNQVMIAEGYAFEYTYNRPYKYQAQFKDAQRNAQTQQLGLWAPTTCNGVASDVTAVP